MSLQAERSSRTACADCKHVEALKVDTFDLHRRDDVRVKVPNVYADRCVFFDMRPVERLVGRRA